MLYGNYRFKCRLETEAAMPFYKGSTFRGVFGHALKRVVCALKRQECGTCLLKSRCIYALVFETPLALQAPEGARVSAPPHPFVIEPPLNGDERFEQGSAFECGLILFGEVNNSLPYFVYAFDRMGQIGIGKRIEGRRGRFVLEEVRSGEDTVYSGLDQKKLKNRGAKEISLPDPVNSASEEQADMKIRVSLETPLRLKFENRFKADLPFHVLVRAALRRISSLFSVYDGGEPDIDYKGLVRRAEDVRAVENRLAWFDWRRYSSRQDQRMFMGGMVGTVTYEGRLGEYLPLLDFAGKVHLGKNTSFGLGKISVTN